jgi:hypothetical protein
MSDTLHENLSMFILLTAVRNILSLDNSAEGTRSCLSMAALDGFMLLTALCSATKIKR